ARRLSKVRTDYKRLQHANHVGGRHARARIIATSYAMAISLHYAPAMMKRIVPLVMLLGCGSDSAPPGGGVDAATITPPVVQGDPLAGLPTGPAAWNALCAKHYGDMISAKLCAGSAPPAISSLADLEALLGLTVAPNPNNDPYA